MPSHCLLSIPTFSSSSLQYSFPRSSASRNHSLRQIGTAIALVSSLGSGRGKSRYRDGIDVVRRCECLGAYREHRFPSSPRTAAMQRIPAALSKDKMAAGSRQSKLGAINVDAGGGRSDNCGPRLPACGVKCNARDADEFVAMYKEMSGHPIVEPAHMELAKPTIADAFDQCVQQGATRIIISPYFLFPGRHWSQDIPALAAQAATRHAFMPYLVTAPIGLHELMVTVLEDRMNYCLSRVAGEVAECHMCAGTGRCQQLSSSTAVDTHMGARPT